MRDAELSLPDTSNVIMLGLCHFLGVSNTMEEWLRAGLGCREMNPSSALPCVPPRAVGHWGV